MTFEILNQLSVISVMQIATKSLIKTPTNFMTLSFISKSEWLLVSHMK